MTKVLREDAKGDKRLVLPQHLLDKLPPEDQMIPELRRLPNKRMQLFVLAILEQTGKSNLTAAALAAGYGTNATAVKVHAHHLAHDPRIIEAVQAMAKKRIRFATLQAESLLVEFMADTKLPPKLRMDAANSILDRGGLNPIFEAKITHEHQLGREEKLLRYAELLKKQGKDPREAFGNLVDLLPNDFKVLEDKADETDPR